MANVKGFIFDLYGTLMQIEGDKYAQILKNQVTDEEDFKLAAKIALTTQTNHPDEILTQLDYEPTNADISGSTITIFNETLPTLQKLKDQGYKIGLISNLATPFIEPVNITGISELLDSVVYSCEVGRAKPDSQIYHLAIHQLRLNPYEIVMIGDKEKNDYHGPQQVGIKAVHLKRPDMNLQDAVEEAFDLYT